MPGGQHALGPALRPFPLRSPAARAPRCRPLDGTTYVDFLGEYTAGLSGTPTRPSATRIADALDRGLDFGDATPRTALAELLCARFPAIDLVRFTNSGTEANLMAIALAARITDGAEGSWSSGTATTAACCPSATAPARSRCRTSACSPTTTTSTAPGR